MHAFEEYYAEELAFGKRPQDILDPFGSPEDLAKELVRKRKPGSADSLKEKRLSQSLHLYCVGTLISKFPQLDRLQSTINTMTFV